MRLVTFEDESGLLKPGAMVENKVVDLVASDPSLPGSLKEILAAGPGVLERVSEVTKSEQAVVVENPILRAPVPNPDKVICIGLNYRDHAEESGMAIPEEPLVFNKFASTIIGPEEAIRLPSISSEVDYEAELVAVIGRRGKSIPQDSAMDYVAGYTVGHDVSARDWQLNKPGGQWLLGKTFDTFAPIGPTLVTADEVDDPHALRICLRRNGETLQDSSTSQLIFRIDELIAYMSNVVTLEPGDLIFTGTPPGVGFARKPPIFLQPGDVCEVEIEGLGILRNPCVGEE